MDSWDEETDVIVVGSGAAGLTAAVTAAQHGAGVILIEKDRLLGGTTAVSGGGVWIPDNLHAADRRALGPRARHASSRCSGRAEVGVDDSREVALGYMRLIGRGGSR